MNTIAVIGLGYVGLPLVVEFGKQARTIGFDIATAKVDSCQRGVDPSRELSDEDMRAAVHAEYSSDPKILGEADIIIIAVPTPVDAAHTPDFTPLIGASKSAGANLKKGAIVVYESTVYPGATEEICIPVLERESGLKWKQDFFVGYSPERINPGDRERTLTTIVKVVSGDTPETLDKVAALYEKIVKPGVHRTSSINADDHPLMRMFHKPVDEKRMVVILPPERYQDWLRSAPEQSKNFLVAYPADALIAVIPPLLAVNFST